MTAAVTRIHERDGGWERTAALLLTMTGWCVRCPKAEPTESCNHPCCFLQLSLLHSYILVFLSYQYNADCFLYSSDLVVYVLPELQGNQLTWRIGWRSVDVFLTCSLLFNRSRQITSMGFVQLAEICL
ncbi:uncharacterized protein LOC125508074 [Triticum urartu]|uniref:uncharacterized protein LOC125508074 n=1 Tax=Triticum urartu TaxID=4572 RepID=UPI002043942D|nr:uncharacterized protein LOC125508074 [Triticum urartu]